MIRLVLICLAPLILCQCELLDPVLRPSRVIYAQPSRTGLASPLDAKRDLVQPVIAFSRDHFTLTPKQDADLKKQALAWSEHPPDVQILGFARRALPVGYARALSQRRADAVRQALIDAGVDAAKLHATGYGSDQPALCDADEVRMFIAK